MASAASATLLAASLVLAGLTALLGGAGAAPVPPVPPTSPPTLLVIADDSIQAFDLFTGVYRGVFLSRQTTGGVLGTVDSIAKRPGDDRLYISTFYGPAHNSTAHPGAIQMFSKSGKYLGRFDSGYQLLRPYGMAFVHQPREPSARRAGVLAAPPLNLNSQLVVAGLGNDALAAFNSRTGKFDKLLARGAHVTASAQGPSGVLLSPNGRTLFVTTEGTATEPRTLEVAEPPELQSALLAVDVFTGSVAFVDSPPPAPGAPFTSLLGLAIVPPTAVPGAGIAPLLVVSDHGGGLRYYTADSHRLVKVVETAVVDPDTNSRRETLRFGRVMVYGPFLYLPAYDAVTLEGMVLRYLLGGQPAGALLGRWAGTPVWIEPSKYIQRASGAAVLE